MSTMSANARESLILANMDSAARYGRALRCRYGLAPFMDRDDAAQIAMDCLVRAVDYALENGVRPGGVRPLVIHFIRQQFARECQKARGYRADGPKRDVFSTGEGEVMGNTPGDTTGRRDFLTPLRLLTLGEEVADAVRRYATGQICGRFGGNPWAQREEMMSLVKTLGIKLVIDVKEARRATRLARRRAKNARYHARHPEAKQREYAARRAKLAAMDPEVLREARERHAQQCRAWRQAKRAKRETTLA